MSFEDLQKKWANQFAGSPQATAPKIEAELLKKIRRGRRIFRLVIVVLAFRDAVFLCLSIWMLKIAMNGGIQHLSPEAARRDGEIRLWGLGLLVILTIAVMKIRPTWVQVTPSASEGHAALPGRVHGDGRRFDAMILWRDIREIGAGIFLVFITIAQAWHAKHPSLVWAAAGLFITPSVFFLIHRLKAQPPERADDTVLGALTRSIYQTRRQVRLLDNLWWYVVPIMLGCILLGPIQRLLTEDGAHRHTTSGFIVFISLGWAVWKLNRWLARSRLRPRLEQLEKLKAELSIDALPH